MLKLTPSIVSGLATLFESAATPKPCPAARRPLSLTEQAAYEVMPVILPSSADAIHRLMSATTPDDWADEPDGMVDLSEYVGDLAV